MKEGMKEGGGREHVHCEQLGLHQCGPPPPHAGHLEISTPR